jgi:hypothetical protein
VLPCGGTREVIVGQFVEPADAVGRNVERRSAQDDALAHVQGDARAEDSYAAKTTSVITS